MTVMEKRPELDVRSRETAELRVERTDISFQDVAGDKVRIQVTVRNAGCCLSRPTVVRLESAPLGAFVAWRPLTRLPVPSLEPGESHDLSIDVARPRPVPLGNFDRVPPKKLLTAVNSPDQPSAQSGPGLMAMLNLFGRGKPAVAPETNLTGRTSLAPDLWDLLGRGQPHWAGNINVFVGSRAVERHFARALRIYPGRTNLAIFMVGSPAKPDAFAFELVGLPMHWVAALYDVSNRKNLLLDPANEPIEETRWVESAGDLMAMLAVQPPSDCTAGEVEVHVTSRSRGREAIVEFNLNPAAQGPGCYFL